MSVLGSDVTVVANHREPPGRAARGFFISARWIRVPRNSYGEEEPGNRREKPEGRGMSPCFTLTQVAPGGDSPRQNTWNRRVKLGNPPLNDRLAS